MVEPGEFCRGHGIWETAVLSGRNDLASSVDTLGKGDGGDFGVKKALSNWMIS